MSYKPDYTELRKYINTLSEQEGKSYAERCGTSLPYLRKACSAKPKMDGALCRRLEAESVDPANKTAQVSKAKLRPDIWPELITIAGVG